MRCEQEVAGGRDVYRLALPAVIGVKEGLNLPRYPSVPGRLRAKRKPLESSSPQRPQPRLAKLRLTLPPGAGKQAQILGDGPDAAPGGGRGAPRAGAPVMAAASVLVLVEHADGEPDELSLQALALARGYAAAIDGAIAAVLIGGHGRGAGAALGAHGVSSAFVAQHDALDDPDGFAPDAWAASVVELIERLAPAAVIAAGSDRGNEILARVGARVDQPMAANCIAAAPAWTAAAHGHAAALGRQPARGGDARRHAGAAHRRAARGRRANARGPTGGGARGLHPGARRRGSARRGRRARGGKDRRRVAVGRRTSSSPAAAASARRRASPSSRSSPACSAARSAARAP